MSSPDGPHRARAPHRQADAARVGPAVVAAVALEQRLGHRLPGLPGEPGRDGLGVDGVEVAAGRQHVDQPAQRRPGRPGGDEAAVERVQHARSSSSVVPSSRGHDLLGGEPQHAARPRSPETVGDRVGPRRRVPAGVPPCRRPARGPRPRPRRRAGLRSRVARRARAPRAGRAGAARRPRSGGRAASRAPGRPAPRPAGAAPSTCRPSRICASLISQSQPSTCRMKSSNSVVVRALVQAEVVVELGGLDQRPDLRADRGQLRRVHRGDVGVLVEQLLEPGDVAVGLGARHRRDRWSTSVACARRLACVPSPGSLTRNG